MKPARRCEQKVRRRSIEKDRRRRWTRSPAETRIAEDLGVDSFGSVELMFEIEEAFGLEIPDGDIMHVRSVKDITAYLEAWFSRTARPQA